MDSVFDTSEHPLCRLQVGKAPTTQDFEHMLGEYEDELAQGRSFCVLANATATKRLELEQVKMIANFGERNQRELANCVGALALVVPSAMVRGALKVAFQLKAPPHPYKVVKTIKEAEDYLAPYVAAIA